MALVLHECQEKRAWEAAWVENGALAIGSLADAQNVECLRREGITHVLTVASRLKVWEGNHNEVVHPPDGIVHLQVDIDDHPRADLLSILPECLEFLHGALGKSWPPGADRKRGHCDARPEHAAVLVHCASGVSRSVAVAAAYMMITAGMNLDDALRTIRRHRPHANPNFGFRYQLQCLEKAGGDIAAAADLVKEEQAGANEDITDVVRKQRHKANVLHARVDEAEETLADLARSGGAPPGHPVWKELLSCVDILVKEKKSRLGGYSDKPAAVIRRSACSKATRLLEMRPQSA